MCGALEQDSKSADADLFLIFDFLTPRRVRTHAPQIGTKREGVMRVLFLIDLCQSSIYDIIILWVN